MLKAIGAPSGQIVALFLGEAALLSFLGGALGLLLAAGAIGVAEYLYPQFPLDIPSWALVTALAVAVGCGLLFGVLPALRAARLDPVESLSRR